MPILIMAMMTAYALDDTDADNMKGQFVAVPRKEEVKELEGVNEQLVVELYSR